MKKSEKFDLGWTLETITKITSKTRIQCIFEHFHQLGFIGADVLATALKDGAQQQTLPTLPNLAG